MSNTDTFHIRHLPSSITGRIPKQYPWLSEDQFCDVCVVGGGITGALCAHKAAEKGYSVVLLEAGEIGFGATAFLPSTLEADGGFTFTELAKYRSTDDIVRLFALGLTALDELEQLCRTSHAEQDGDEMCGGFQRNDLLLCTDDPSELPLLEKEYQARKHHRFDCTRLTAETARDAFPFPLQGGILSKGAGGCLDPYRFTHLCLTRAAELGAGIFEHTAARDIQTPRSDGGSVIIATSTHRTIYADRLILATGNEGIKALLPHARRQTAYSAASHPLPQEQPNGWPGQCVVRTFGSPHIACGVTPDGRIAAVHSERPRIGQNTPMGRLLSRCTALGKRYRQTEDMMKQFFPGLSELPAACICQWDYLTTRDGLPLLGEHPDYPSCFFALCTGRGTALYSCLAAAWASQWIEGQCPDDLALFRTIQ